MTARRLRPSKSLLAAGLQPAPAPGRRTPRRSKPPRSPCVSCLFVAIPFTFHVSRFTFRLSPFTFRPSRLTPHASRLDRGCVADQPQQRPRVQSVSEPPTPPDRTTFLRLTFQAQSRSGTDRSAGLRHGVRFRTHSNPASSRSRSTLIEDSNDWQDPPGGRERMTSAKDRHSLATQRQPAAAGIPIVRRRGN
jgi:hypothetical protein